MQRTPSEDRVVYRITDEYAIVRRGGSPMLYLEWREGGVPVRRTTSTADLEHAKRSARAIILTHAKISAARPEEALIASVVDRHYLRHGHKLESASSIKRSVKLWVEFFGNETVADLTADRQRAFKAWLEDRDYSPGYVRRVIGDGKAAINMAWQEGEIRQVPFVKLPPVGKGYPHYAKFEQLAALLNAPMPDHLFTYCLIRLNTGCRGDAASDLQRFQVDEHMGLIELNPPGREQTKKFRPIVPLTEFLRCYLATVPAADYYVHWYGRRVKSVRTTWRAIRMEAGLPAWFVPRVLRHTVGTELRRRGVPGWDVSGQLGHKKGESAPTTENYAKFDPDYLAAAKQAFDCWMVELAAVVPRMRDATAMTLDADGSAKTRTARTSEGRAVAGFHAGGSVVGGTGFEPVTPTMSR